MKGSDQLENTESVSQIRQQYKNCKAQDLQRFISQYEKDGRKGVCALVAAAEKALESLEREKARIEEMRFYERKYEAFHTVCGIDEVGRGPLAGPVVACALVLPRDCRILYVNDSKKLSAAKRESLYEEILSCARGVGIGCVSHERIDEINILQATYEAMREAVSKLPIQPDLLLNDAVTIPGLAVKQVPIIHGDGKSLTIAAASIVAKVTRDRMMAEYDTLFPQYDFAGNKGYGSEKHIAAIKKYGPCPIHRRSFIGNFVN